MKKMANVKLLVYLLGMLMLATPGKKTYLDKFGNPNETASTGV